VRGHGFSLYGLLPDRMVDRSFVTQRLEAGWFDLVVLGQVWRQWGQLLDLAPWLQKVPVVLLDGDDDPRLFHRSGTRLRRYGWQPFPIRSGRCLYWKREWKGEGRQGRWCKVQPASFAIPGVKIRPLNLESRHQRFAKHCVDPEVAMPCGLHTHYAFASEQAYYDDLAQSRYAITTKRGGWDCLRHYEIAAAGALLCFRQLEMKPRDCAPHGLQPWLNCLSYRDWPDLRKQCLSTSLLVLFCTLLLHQSTSCILCRYHSLNSRSRHSLGTIKPCKPTLSSHFFMFYCHPSSLLQMIQL